MSDADLTEVEAAELFGAQAREVQPDEDQLMVQLALRIIRDELMAAAEHDRVGVNQWARRLGISPSSVSRFLGGEGDFHVSTAVLYARALGHRWSFTLESDQGCARRGNYSGRPEMTFEVMGSNRSSDRIGNTETDAAPTIVLTLRSPHQLPHAESLMVQSVA